MRIFNKFIESKKEPSNKNDIWFDGSVFRIYKEEEWKAFTVNLNDANEIAKLKDELYKFLYDEAKPTVEEAKQAAVTIQEYVDKAIDALANSESAIAEATALKSQTEQLIEQGNVVIENANKAANNADEISSNIKAIWDDLFIEINNSITSANEAANNANTAVETIDSKIAEKVEPVLNLLDTLPFFNLNEDYTKIIKGEVVRTEEFVRDVSGHNYLIGYDGEMYYINDALIIGAIIPSTISYVELEMSRWYVSNSSFKYNEESNKYEHSGFYGFIPTRLLFDGTDGFSDVLFPHSGGHNMILKTEQELTEEEKAQVKKNLDIKEGGGGSYDDTELRGLIAAQGGKIMKSDWNEDDGAKYSYVKNRTHYIKGSNITGAGTYRATTGHLLFDGKMFDLPADTTEITISSGPVIKAKWIATESQVIVTTGPGGDSYLEAYPIKVVEEYVPLDENFIPDSIARQQELTELSEEVALRNVGAEPTDDSVDEPEIPTPSVSNEWKCVFDGRMEVGAKSLKFTTYADGTPLKAMEAIVQVLMDDKATALTQGYVIVHSTSNTTDCLYGAIHYEREEATATTPIMCQMYFKASPFFMIAEQYDLIKPLIAQGLALQGRLGNKVPPQIYEDITYIELRPNVPIGSVAPLIKIYAL